MDVIRVVDVPKGATADEAQRLMNGPCAENRYLLVQVLQLPNGNTRAIYRLLARAVDKDLEGRTALTTNRDGKEAEALDFLRAHPEMSLRVMEAELAAIGIKRSKDWLMTKRHRLLARGSRRADVGSK